MTRRRRLFSLIGLLLLAAAATLWATRAVKVDASALPDHKPDLENGERMFWAGGCASCHAAPGAKDDDKVVLAGGLELKSPFGTFRVPNISPSPEAGIGGWSDADFVSAMVKGTSPDGRHYYPAFPYTSYQRMRIEDLLDLRAYLATLPPSDNRVGGHDLNFPYWFRPGVGLWKLLYLDGKPFTPDPDWDETVARGAYLLQGPGHCSECHTPRDALGGLDQSRFLAGASNPEGGEGTVPNITPDPSGIGSWSASDIAYFLETGFTPDYDSVGGSMAAVQENWARLPAEDREAIAAYLKTVPARPAYKP